MNTTYEAKLWKLVQIYFLFLYENFPEELSCDLCGTTQPGPWSYKIQYFDFDSGQWKVEEDSDWPNLLDSDSGQWLYNWCDIINAFVRFTDSAAL